MSVALPQHPYSWDRVPPECRALFVDRIPADEKRHFMRKAIAAAKRSPFRPTVGAVIVRDGRVLATGYRDCTWVNDGATGRRTRAVHAEEMALLNAPSDLTGATLYSTLEPCFDRSRPGADEQIEACSSRVARRGISTVVIGLADHELRNLGTGAAFLAERGVQLEFAYEGLERELYDIIGNGRFWHAPPGLDRWRRKLRRLARKVRHRR